MVEDLFQIHLVGLEVAAAHQSQPEARVVV